MGRMYNVCAQSFWNTCSGLDCHTAQCVGKGDPSKTRHGLLVSLWTNAVMLTPFVAVFMIFAEPITSIFFPGGYTGAAFAYAVRFFRIYAPFLYANMIGHLLHSYMRSIGCVGTVLWVTLAGSISRVASTLLLVPRLGIDGAYIGQVISWFVDGGLSALAYFLLFHNLTRLARVIDRRRAGR